MPTASCLAEPFGIGFDKTGSLWAADGSNGRLVRFDAPFTTSENASLAIGQDNFTTGVSVGLANATASNMLSPTSVAFDSSGNLWMTDDSFDRVLEFSVSVTGSQTSSSTVSTTSLTTLSTSSSASSASISSSATGTISTSSASAQGSSSSTAVTTNTQTSSSSSSTSISLNYLAVVAVVGIVMAVTLISVRRKGIPRIRK